MKVPMQDDDILRVAERIKRRRKNEARMASLETATGVMIRWDVPGAPFSESYVSIAVTADEIREIVVAKLAALIQQDAAEYSPEK